MISEDGGRGEATKNPDLARMHRDLVALVAQLERSIDDAPNAAAICASSKALKLLTQRPENVATTYIASPASIVGRRPIRSHRRPHTTTPAAKARKYTDMNCDAACAPTLN